MKGGLSSLKDHPFFHLTKESTLKNYGENLNLIELDSIFYGIPKKETVEKWQQEVSKDFTFLIKAYGGMTDHKNWQENYQSEEEMYKAFQNSFQPLKDSGQIGSVLFQFSASFVFSKENALKIMQVRKYLPDWPLAIEFRHGSWFVRENIKKTLTLLTKERITLVAVDEPQLAHFPVPFFIFPTNKKHLYVRFHGRNKLGWLSQKREFRTLYDYSLEELAALSEKIQEKKEQFEEIFIVFNNNAGFHAAKNLMDFKTMNQNDWQEGRLNPKQTDLF